MRRNILLKLEYCGTRFKGWQVQAKGRTVQGVLQESLMKFSREDIKLIASGRTDTGVHALAQYANFRTTRHAEPDDIRYKLNRILADDIVVTGCWEVQWDFNSRRDAENRSYRYLISERLSALRSGFAWILGRPLDITLLRNMAEIIRNSAYFGNFCKVKSRKTNDECLVINSSWSRYGGLLRFDITANRFLHNMIRLLVGTMLAVHDGKMKMSKFKSLFKNNVDENTKYIAPAEGLYLADVKYEGIKL